MLRLLCLLAILLCGFAAPASAWDGTGDAYFDAAVIEPALLPAPPAANSPEWMADMRAVKQAQRRVTPAQKVMAYDEDEMRLDHITRVVDAKLNAETHPALFKLLNNSYATCRPEVVASKKFWRTDRPFVVDKGIDNWLQRKPSGAYPSGHTTCSRVLAEVLGQVYPQHRATLRARAEEIAMHRVDRKSVV